MNILKDNLSFAIIVTDGGWRTDLTSRFCEYFCYKFNGSLTNILIVDSVDSALEQCQTDYLLIQSGGHITFSENFFGLLHECAVQAQDIFLGHLLMEDDYVKLDSQCIFFNMVLWKQLGSIPFTIDVKNGPELKVTIPTYDKHKPKQIAIGGTERVYVPASCREAGAGLIIAQLDAFGNSTSLNYVPSSSFHLLDLKTPYSEIHSETYYEKNYLALAQKYVHTVDQDDLRDAPHEHVDFIISSARGLKALNLADTYNVKQVIIYANNEFDLELQRRIFSVSEPTLYGDLIEKFKSDFPAAVLVDDWTPERYSVVTKFNGQVDFRIVDIFSYEIEDLIRSVDHAYSLLIDFSDEYTNPINFYRRPLYQVQGLFGEIYSLLKSRVGSTFILGFAPGYQKMNTIEVNTTNVQFEMDRLAQYEPDEEPETPIFKPARKDKDIKEDGWKSPNKEVAEEVKHIVVADGPVNIAMSKGYSKKPHLDPINNLPTGKISLSKEEVFDEFVAIFEYVINETTGSWSFVVGTPTSSKKIEFSNGLSLDGFKKHLINDVKINPAMTSRYFLSN